MEWKMFDFINKDFAPAPPRVPIGEEAFAAIDHTRMYWLGGAGALINARGYIILVDPVMTCTRSEDGTIMCEIGKPLRFEYPISASDLPKVDAVLYTHTDKDHLGPITAPILMKKYNPKFYGPHTVFRKLIELGGDWHQIETIRYKDSFELNDGEIKVKVTPADHAWQLLWPERDYVNWKIGRPGDCVGYIIETPDMKVYVTGDTRMMEEHLEIPDDCDMLMLDVSLCTTHLNPYGARVMANHFSKAVLFPFHYGTYDFDQEAYAGNPEKTFGIIEGGKERGRIIAPGGFIAWKNHIEQAGE